MNIIPSEEDKAKFYFPIKKYLPVFHSLSQNDV